MYEMEDLDVFILAVLVIDTLTWGSIAGGFWTRDGSATADMVPLL